MLEITEALCKLFWDEAAEADLLSANSWAQD